MRAKSALLVRWGNNYAGSVEETHRNRTEARQLIRTALRIAPNLAEAHLVLSTLYSSSLQMSPAIAELKRARALAPGDADTVASYARFLSNIGHHRQAVSVSEQAIASDPLNSSAYLVRIYALFYSRRYGDAVSFANSLIARSPELVTEPVTVGDALVAAGNYREAQAWYSKAEPNYWGRITGEAIAKAREGDRAGALAKLQQLRDLHGDGASTQIAEIYAQLGEREPALSALETAYAVKDGGLTMMLVDPWLDPLRKEPRFAAIVQKMNFPA